MIVNDAGDEGIGLGPLDAEPGPARRLSPEAAQALARLVLAKHHQRRRASRQRVVQLTAAAALLLGCLSIGVAAFQRRWAARIEVETLEPPAPPKLPPASPTPPPEGETPPAGSPPREEPAAVHRAGPDWLAKANALRSKGLWRAAAATYERAARSSPGSHQACAATVAAAVIHQERLRDPARAARLFRRALALEPSGPLAEEALWGIAEAHRRLRHRTAEQAALREFLERHPNGASAPQARQRLEQLAR